MSSCSHPTPSPSRQTEPLGHCKWVGSSCLWFSCKGSVYKNSQSFDTAAQNPVWQRQALVPCFLCFICNWKIGEDLKEPCIYSIYKYFLSKDLWVRGQMGSITKSVRTSSLKNLHFSGVSKKMWQIKGTKMTAQYNASSKWVVEMMNSAELHLKGNNRCLCPK